MATDKEDSSGVGNDKKNNDEDVDSLKKRIECLTRLLAMKEEEALQSRRLVVEASKQVDEMMARVENMQAKDVPPSRRALLKMETEVLIERAKARAAIDHAEVATKQLVEERLRNQTLQRERDIARVRVMQLESASSRGSGQPQLPYY